MGKVKRKLPSNIGNNLLLKCSNWTDFQIAFIIFYHDDNYQWINEYALRFVADRLKKTTRQVRDMHNSFQPPPSDCNGGYPQPRNISVPVEGSFKISKDQVDIIISIMLKMKKEAAFADCDGTKTIRYGYVIPPAHAPQSGPEYTNKAILNRRAQLYNACVAEPFDMFTHAYKAVHTYMSRKDPHLFRLFKEKHGTTKLPSQCFINYYDSKTHQVVPKHKDRVPFCSLSISLTADEGCLSVWHGIDKVTYPLGVGDYVLYDRLWHSVVMDGTNKRRCTINLFY